MASKLKNTTKLKNSAALSFAPYRLSIVRRDQQHREFEEKTFPTAGKMIAFLRKNPPAPEQAYDLRGVDFSGQDLSGISLSHCSLSYADLTGADLSGARLDHVKMIHTKLAGADLTAASLNEANFRYAEMAGTIMTGATVKETVFVSAQMDGLKADATEFSRVSFNDVQAAGASFRAASFDIVEFISANLDKTDFSGVVHAENVSAEHTTMIDAKVSPVVGRKFAGEKLYDARVSPAAMMQSRRKNRKLTV